MRLGDLDTENAIRAENYLARLVVIKRLARHIIDFLAQIEDFQKRLFERPKFVLASEWCVTLDRVPKSLYPAIIANKAQWAEWERLFGVKKPNGGAKKTEAFLAGHPTLTIDTAFYDAGFKDQLLAALSEAEGGLAAQRDGLLIHGENFQALTLLQEAYRGKVKCIYIDPPYNTASSSIPYKNDYRHSSWITMMYDRLAALRSLLSMDGAIFVSIDKVERAVLEHTLDSVFGPENRIEELIWSMNTNNSQAPNYSTNHEYVLVYARDRQTAEQDRDMFREPKPGFREVMDLVGRLNSSYPPISVIESEIRALYEQHKIDYREEIEAQGLDWEDEKGNDPWRGIYNYSHAEYRDSGGKLIPESEAKKRQGQIWVWQEGDASMPATKQAASTRDPSHPNYRFYKPPHPVTGKPCPHPKSGWKFAYKDDEDSPDKRSFISLDRDGRIAWGTDETKVPRLKRMLHEVETNVGQSVFQDYSDGEKQTSAMFGQSGVFLAPKHSDFVSRFIIHSAKRDSIILDCFGGSGSTGHAVIKLNREDRGKRKYLLVEVGEYFDTVLKPRIQKVIYAGEWRNGQPVEGSQGSSHTFQYLQLESYEDTLDNLDLAPPPPPGLFPPEQDDYLLKYMLDHETRGARLNVSAFATPFDYQLRVWRDGVETRVKVDLLETANYLLGLIVTAQKAYQHQKRTYRVVFGTVGRDLVVIIWRDTAELDLHAEAEFAQKEILAGQAPDRLYVNGESHIPNAWPIEAVFMAAMRGEA